MTKKNYNSNIKLYLLVPQFRNKKNWKPICFGLHFYYWILSSQKSVKIAHKILNTLLFELLLMSNDGFSMLITIKMISPARMATFDYVNIICSDATTAS